MRLVFPKKARAEPVDRMQHRVLRQNVADPFRHHSRHIENSGTEVQKTGQLSPYFVPGLGECIDHGIEEAASAAEQPDNQERDRDAGKILRQCAEPRSADASTMRTRSTCLRGRLRSAAIADNCSRSAMLNTTHTCCAMAPVPHAMAQYRIS